MLSKISKNNNNPKKYPKKYPKLHRHRHRCDYRDTREPQTSNNKAVSYCASHIQACRGNVQATRFDIKCYPKSRKIITIQKNTQKNTQNYIDIDIVSSHAVVEQTKSNYKYRTYLFQDASLRYLPRKTQKSISTL